MYFLATIFFHGLQNAKLHYLDQVLRLNIGVWLMLLLILVGYAIYCASFIYRYLLQPFFCDNVSAIYLSSNPVQHQRTKQIEIGIYFVRDLVVMGHIRVLHVPSCYQYADIFTKVLPIALFDEFRSNLSVRSSPAPNAGSVSVVFVWA